MWRTGKDPITACKGLRLGPAEGGTLLALCLPALNKASWRRVTGLVVDEARCLWLRGGRLDAL
jgi:hypothetical protein